eukprot:15441942-Alexandrium_andersonii.AAC.1
MGDECLFPVVSPQASEMRTAALADVYRMSFLDRTDPPPAATGSSSRGTKRGDYQKTALQERVARSI